MSSSHPHKPFPVLIGSQQIYRGRVVDLRVDEVEIAPGLNVRREVVQHPGAVVIVPLDGAGRLLWVRQYRWPVRRALLELPAGTLEAGEEPLVCARRELAEEVGHAAASWQELGAFFTAPGFCTEQIYAFAARSLTPAPSHGDADEDIQVVPLTVEESLAALDSGELQDAKSIAALHLWLRRLGP